MSWGGFFGGGYDEGAAFLGDQKDLAVIGRRYRVLLKNNYELGYPQLPPGLGPIGLPPNYSHGSVVHAAGDEIVVLLLEKIPGNNDATKRWQVRMPPEAVPPQIMGGVPVYHYHSFGLPYDKFDLLGSVMLEQGNMIGLGNGYTPPQQWFRRPPPSPTSGIP